MHFNIKKCNFIRFSQKKVINEVNYKMDDVSLVRIKSAKHFGITVSDTRWARHISEITLKANRTLGLIKRVYAQILRTSI